ncbi:MAG: hypothetical protein ACU0DW_13100 [Shimia sp.]
MTDRADTVPGYQPGTIKDPNQANLTARPKDAEPKPSPVPAENWGQPGTTIDPNQANRS